MAVEKFLTYAVNETHHWEPSVLEQSNGSGLSLTIAICAEAGE